ncbi:MAG: hypothetical protein F4Z17_04175 [Acidimicrobiia bacterium]|nr:hypothetical protein [Acidimicrobiia bacterium]
MAVGSGAAPMVELADMEVRWVAPVNGMPNGQSATLSLRPDVEFQAADPLLQFGAVVALASDRYASLPFVEADAGSVGSDLWLLMERLRPLGDHLGGLDSFNDFTFLLDHIGAYVPAPSQDGSGYSR